MSKQTKTILIITAIIIVAAGLIYFNRGVKLPAGGSFVGNLRQIDSTDHIDGQLNAPVKMIIYSDFECPFCADFSQTVKQIKEYFGEKIVVAFRHYPLPGHPDAVTAAQASECAAEQGKFWQLHDKLFEDNLAGRMSLVQFKLDAADLGLNQGQFNQCLDSGKYAGKVADEKAEGDKAGVTGTPTSFINGFIYPGAYPFEDFTGSDGRPEKGMKSIISGLLK